ncbi:MAG: homoserine dehydrogenase [Verrucomicrobia bacterium]|nr:homoserine dehydrogenase [Verrucomicrobiota bacterium]MCG2678677.1 homoserine dehydrogenase [Kiritimatiellia bacterium]MBU4248498.1 homoserine dehydrogenase [Verrucomicrobiota bacterium]MBU4291310.1 homoserine dehydrogenase [Verrucomicrobiota bacterium]MBU4429182.1 homoserine dehydrogenase [Verrucomicrobiota bacterium]
MNRKEIGVGLLGFGTIGSGVVKSLQDHGDLIESRTGLRLVLRRIADIDGERDRGVRLAPGLLTHDAASVVNSPDVDLVIELIGGVGAAKDLMVQALSLGKPVITANKALLAEHGEEIFRLAEDHQANVFFEASVGGGIPLIRSLREGLVSNRIQRIYGILNGTCNYILTRMEQDRISFDKALKDAQKAGFAEVEPALDIDGIDTAHKAVILASLAYGFHVPMKAVAVEGIRGFNAIDISYALDLGYRIKMLAVIKEINGEVEIRVHPTLIPMNHILSSVHGIFNAVLIEGDSVGDMLCYGQGAGRDPTASAVLSDVVDAARDLTSHVLRRAPGFILHNHAGRIREIGASKVRYYLRLTLLDKPGVFGQIGAVLGRHGISIASLLQKEVQAGKQVPVIVITHLGHEQAFREAMEEIDALNIVGAKTVRFRIEDF